MTDIKINESGLIFHMQVMDDKSLRLSQFGPDTGFEAQPLVSDRNVPLEIQVTGENFDDHHGSKFTGTNPGRRMKYVSHREIKTGDGKELIIIAGDNGLEAELHYRFYNGIPVVRSWAAITNNTKSDIGIEYISSFRCLGISNTGLQSWDEKSFVHIPHNTWCGESMWRRANVRELGLSNTGGFNMKRITAKSTGTWSTSEFLPMGMLENAESGTIHFWQIEHNGSWSWEIGDLQGQLYLALNGPCEQEHGWWKNLKPGQSFTTVPVAVGALSGGFDDAVRELTKYRRAIMRPCRDNRDLPVIFNDYMNCLFGDPTTEKLIPLIDAAAKAGCEYFCIDCGWYSDGAWWDGVGEWLPSAKRFPGGIKEPLDYIRKKGMVPGLWLELEVMGINCSMVKKVDPSWFFRRHGKPVIDHGRYQLDFTNSEVRAHADKVIDRVVNEYGAGYIKIDYNINAGIGTDTGDSLGDGLLQHNRAYLNWVDGVFARYPELIIENCGSGGLRMDYALLSRHSIQSCTDQTDYKLMSVIASGSLTAVTPEQCAVWSYPLRDGDLEEAAFNMVNAMLARIHQSGHLAQMSAERFALVQEAIQYYKKIRADIARGFPAYPLGAPRIESDRSALALIAGKKIYLAVWCRGAAKKCITVPLGAYARKIISARIAYPAGLPAKYTFSKSGASVTVEFPAAYSARLLEIEIE